MMALGFGAVAMVGLWLVLRQLTASKRDLSVMGIRHRDYETAKRRGCRL